VLKSVFAFACVAAVVVSAQDGFTPARYQAGAVPALPVGAVGGGQVFVELTVGPDGRVTSAKPLRTTPPFATFVLDAVREWRFLPAEKDAPSQPGEAGVRRRIPVATTVLVAAAYRAPALNAPTLGETPKNVASGSEETPFPLTTTLPPFPPLARGSGVVLLEVKVDRGGAVEDATVIGSAPPFDEPARAAVRQWRFRPARVGGVPVSTLVYVVFGFPEPVVGAP